jgi:N,N'-diacetyllegionaminate synthase
MDFHKQIKIGKKIISNQINSPTYIIAEAGVAHLGSITNAKKLVDMAKKSGADAVKFQAYLTDELVHYKYSFWYKRYKSKEVDFNFLKKIKNYCSKKKIEFLCTPHSLTAIDWLKKLKVSAIKIGSGEIGNFLLLKKICKLNLPIIISTGMHNLEELKLLKKELVKLNFKKVAILNCCTSYPATSDQINLLKINDLKRIFKNAPIGYSDHTTNDLAILSSVSLGAKIIEKHIAINFNDNRSQDWKVSHNQKKLIEMVDSIKSVEMMLRNNKFLSKKEIIQKKWASRSIFTKKKLSKNHKIGLEDLVFLRPGDGILVKDLDKIIGKKLNKSFKALEKLTYKSLF